MQNYNDDERNILDGGYPQEEPADQSGDNQYAPGSGMDTESYMPVATQAERGDIPDEDARFSEVDDAEPPMMYTPGIRVNDPYQQRNWNDESAREGGKRRRGGPGMSRSDRCPGSCSRCR